MSLDTLSAPPIATQTNEARLLARDAAGVLKTHWSALQPSSNGESAQTLSRKELTAAITRAGLSANDSSTLTRLREDAKAFGLLDRLDGTRDKIINLKTIAELDRIKAVLLSDATALDVADKSTKKNQNSIRDGLISWNDVQARIETADKGLANELRQISKLHFRMVCGGDTRYRYIDEQPGLTVVAKDGAVTAAK